MSRVITNSFLGTLAAAALPFVVRAQVTPISPISSASGINESICDILKWLYTLAIIAGVFFVILAAYRYMTSGGDPEKVKDAHKAILYAAVGIAVAIIAVGVPGIVASILEGGFGLSFSSFCT